MSEKTHKHTGKKLLSPHRYDLHAFSNSQIKRLKIMLTYSLVLSVHLLTDYNAQHVHQHVQLLLPQILHLLSVHSRSKLLRENHKLFVRSLWK